MFKKPKEIVGIIIFCSKFQQKEKTVKNVAFLGPWVSGSAKFYSPGIRGLKKQPGTSGKGTS